MDARTLATCMDYTLTYAQYERIVGPFNQAMNQAHCTTVNRAAMWCAQIGHESAGLRFMTELASGSEYEGRADLGNTYFGDGPRYKGRGPIQVTGRYNYGKVSAWAHQLGYIPSATWFVEHPEQLGWDQYVFLGPVWYWTIARDMNSYADRGDIWGGTRAVNGGLNGIDNRIRIWKAALNLSNRILPTASKTPREGFTVDAAAKARFDELDRRLARLETAIAAVPRSVWRTRIGNHKWMAVSYLQGARDRAAEAAANTKK